MGTKTGTKFKNQISSKKRGQNWGTKSNNSLKKQFLIVLNSLKTSEGQTGSVNHLIHLKKRKLVILYELGMHLKLDLFDFVQFSEKSKVLQEKISNCENAQQLEKVLKKHDCEFTIENIEKVSRDLAASYWPWYKKTRQERKAFFMKD